MANRIATARDPRIQEVSDKRNRVLTQMREVADKPDFTAADAEALAQMQVEFDALTQAFDNEVKAADQDAVRQEADALMTAGDATRTRTERQTNAEEGVDAQLAAMAQGMPAPPVKLRGQVIGAYMDALQQGIPAADFTAQLTAAQDGRGPMAQDVIGRVGTSGITNITAGSSDLRPQNVEARFVETLTQVLSVLRCGYEVVSTPRDLAAVKFPKGIPNRTNPLTTPDAERLSTADIPERTPGFGFVNTIPREWSALFELERSAEYATPANISGKFGEYLAREYAMQVAASAARGNTANIEEGIAPATLLDTPAQAWLTGVQQTEGDINNLTGGGAIYDNVVDVVKTLPVFMAGGGMGKCWWMTKLFSSTFYKIKATDGHPLFKPGVEVMGRLYDTLWGYPIIYGEDGHLSANPGTANQIGAIFGDFWAACLFRMAGDMEIATDASGEFFRKNQVAYRVIGYGCVIVKNAEQLSYLKHS